MRNLFFLKLWKVFISFSPSTIETVFSTNMFISTERLKIANVSRNISFSLNEFLITFNHDVDSEDNEIDYELAVDAVTVQVSQGSNGTIAVIVDGKLYKTINVTDDKIEYQVDLSGLSLNKNYLVNVTYYDDKNNAKASKQDTIKIIYNIGIDIEDEYVYGQENVISIWLPDEIGNGNLIIEIDGEPVKWTADEYHTVYVDITGFEIGYYDFYLKYGGDEKFYPQEYDKSFDVKAPISGIDDELGYFAPGDDPISIVLPKDAEGNLVVEIYEKDFVDDETGETYYKSEPSIVKEIPLKDGKASYSLDDLPMGDYKVETSYDGDDYSVDSKSTELKVLPSIIFDDSGAKLGDAKPISVVATGGKGNVTIVIHRYNSMDDFEEGNGGILIVNETIELVDGVATYDFTFDKLGTYFIKATCFSEDGTEMTEDEYCTHILPEFEVPDKVIFNRTANITFEVLPDDNDGEITFNFVKYVENEGDGENVVMDSITVKLNQGKATVEIPKLGVGIYDVTYNYTGKYGDNVSDFGSFEISPDITIPSEIKEGEDAVIGFEMDGAEGNFTVTVGDKEYTTEVKNGKANVTIPKEELSGRNNRIGVKYVGNDGTVYERLASDVGKDYWIDVKMTPVLNVTDNAPTTASDLIFTVTLGEKFVSGNVTLTINDKQYNAIFENGAAVVNVGKLPAKTYPVTVTFNGNGKYSPLTMNVTAKVYFEPKIVAKNAKIYYQSGVKYSVTVYGKDGKVAKSTQVVFKVNGKKYKTVKTNSKGKASVTFKQTPKTYKVSAQALGKTVTKKVTIKPILKLKKVSVKKSAKKLQLTATLKKALKGKKITFKFNGKKYTAKTNKKGVAKVTVKKSVLEKLKVGKKVKYQATYVKQTVKKSVRVKK